MSILKRLYDSLNTTSEEYNNAFDTLATNRIYFNFSEKYIETASDEKKAGIRDAFEDSIYTERANAFKVGFYAAIDLIMNRTN